MRRALALILLCVSAAMAAEPAVELTQFDAGKTFLFPPGASFRVRLERLAGPNQAWRWPVIDAAVLEHLGQQVQTVDGKVFEVHSFRTVGPGTQEVHAELTEPGRPGTVRYRFPFAVQVTAE
jgi:hypothetical protein